ncbi:Hypothetical protein SMAX5B_012735 [Scophthalmus maximus]|uniref:Uncharacterized protein n=1 Tax=Scophthalmus maximus TaxID=52904 RepID=A0A2U9BCJ1_SCOMX|nr:Hypothetical protein SMAX5B_012735 [Scophthalmus maximus]
MEEDVKCVWECERGTAGPLLSGLKSLGAPASAQQSQLCFQEDRPTSGHDCALSRFQSQEFQSEKCLLVSQTARNNSETSSHHI